MVGPIYGVNAVKSRLLRERLRLEGKNSLRLEGKNNLRPEGKNNLRPEGKNNLRPEGNGGLERLLVKSGQQSGRLRELVALAESLGCPVAEAPLAEINARLGVDAGRHQGLALYAEAPAPLDEKSLLALVAARRNPLLLALDGVTDPGNLGACLRSAAALGVDAAILPKDRTAPLNQVAAKAASGALDFLPIAQVANLARAIRQLQAAGVWFVGAVTEAETRLPSLDLQGSLCLVLGSEGSGLRHRTRESCDHLAAIPSADAALPFNVSVATGICLYEAHRQRHAG